MATDDPGGAAVPPAKRTRSESVAMRQFRQRQARERRKDYGERAGTDLFPPAGRGVSVAQASLVEQAATEASRKVAAFMDAFTYDFGCDWCHHEPEHDGSKTARILITPAKYNPAGDKCLRRAIYAFACFDCTQRLRLIAVDTKVLVTEREKAKASARAEERRKDKLAQMGLFPDERVNTDPLQNG